MNYHLTLKSRNGKTGPIPVSTTAKESCPPSCPLQGNGCYAEAGPLAMFWGKVDDGRTGTDFAAFLKSVAALPRGQLWRHNQAGDLPGMGNAIDGAALAALVAANGGGFTINLSGNNVAHADELAALAIAPVVVVLPIDYARQENRGQWAETLSAYRARTAELPKKTPAGQALSVCPATYLDTNCQECSLCQRGNRQSIVGFPAHSQNAAKADAIARAVGRDRK